MWLNQLVKLREYCVGWKWEGQEGVAYLPGGVWQAFSTNQINFQLADHLGVGSSVPGNLHLTQPAERERVINYWLVLIKKVS